MRFSITLFILFLNLLFSAQQRNVDSLIRVTKSSKIDSNKIKALNELFSEYRYTDETLATQYARQAIENGSKSDFTKGYALALYNKGVFEGEHGNFDSSDVYLNKAIIEYKKIDDKAGLANCKMAFGFNFYDKADFKEALTIFLEAAKLKETIKDKKGQAAANIWIGNVYNNGLEKPQQALPYYEAALKIQQSIGDEDNMAYTYNNIGNSYYFLNQYPKALEYHLKSAELKEKFGNKRGLSSSYDNIGNVYFDLLNYTKATEYYNKALEIRTEFGDKKGLTTSYVNIGNVYIKQKKYKAAIDMHTRAFDFASEIGNKEVMKEASNSLAACYEAIGDFNKAFEYLKLSSALKDSILNTTFTEQIAEMQTRYDVEKKDLEIANQKADIEIKEKQGLIKNIIIVSILLLLGFSFLVGYIFYRKKQVEQKAKLNAEIANQKDLRAKAVIEAEEKERRRIAQDLHDGVGQLLSATKLNLSNLESKLTLQNENEKSALETAISLVDDSVKEVRAVSHNMMPNTLIKLGLASAVREFITKLGHAPSLKVDLEIVGLDSRLDNKIETVLYRVIQELVNNIIKHAKATHITMQLIRHEQELNVMIEDNGIGFNTKDIESFEGIGLKGIQTRIDFLNGTVFFDSTVGKGTTVIIDIPII